MEPDGTAHIQPEGPEQRVEREEGIGTAQQRPVPGGRGETATEEGAREALQMSGIDARRDRDVYAVERAWRHVRAIEADRVHHSGWAEGRSRRAGAFHRSAGEQG
jgi:hypothetical protein